MIPGPPARWMAPSTPPPPTSALFAALTMTSALIRVMSPWTRRMRREGVPGHGGKGSEGSRSRGGARWIDTPPSRRPARRPTKA